ncbi:MAG: hypothetical protein JWM33_2431 [Caulobacteraceae bacterium]|nr:hypothetical protein [Caulobacteraceae bacterium]
MIRAAEEAKLAKQIATLRRLHLDAAEMSLIQAASQLKAQQEVRAAATLRLAAEEHGWSEAVGGSVLDPVMASLWALSAVDRDADLKDTGRHTSEAEGQKAQADQAWRVASLLSLEADALAMRTSKRSLRAREDKALDELTGLRRVPCQRP